MAKRRPEPPADGDLWQRYTAEVKPLRKVPMPKPPKPPPPPPPIGRKKVVTPPKLPPRAAVAPPRPQRAPEKPLANLDRNSADRLRRGEMPLEARLDLHGMTQGEAHQALNAFLARSHLGGLRCVLVITGKGAERRDGPAAGIMREGRGVLREAVPRWLTDPGNSDRVLAWVPARPQHGGNGALYVLLRRQRER